MTRRNHPILHEKDLLGNVPSLNAATDMVRSAHWEGTLPATAVILARGWEHNDRIALPCLRHASDGLLDQYIDAFRKVAERLGEVPH